MNLRLASAVATTCVALTLAPPIARAEEAAPPADTAWVAPVESLDTARARLGLSTKVLIDSSLDLTPSSPTTPLRLSPEAKTAIIIAAIVGGCLLILGLVIIARPGRHDPL